MTLILASDRKATPQHGLLVVALGMVLAWQRRQRSRAVLARLDSHMLRDIGLDLDEVQAEVSKPFWRD